MADLERLVVSLEASITKYERAMQKALGQTNATAKRIETRFNRMGQTMNRGFNRIFAVATGAIGARQLQNLVDAFTRIENQLRLAGLQGEALRNTFSQLSAMALKNGASIEALSTLYGRATQSAKELGASREDILKFTEGVAAALRVAGTSPEAASGALLQLSQALGSAVVRAEEFNSINEGARPILQAVANGIQEAGGSVSKLRQLVLDGKVSNSAFFAGFQIGSAGLITQASETTLTISQQFENLRTVSIAAAGDIDEAFGISERVGGVIGVIGESLQKLSDISVKAAPILKEIRDTFFDIVDLAPEVDGLVSRQAAGEILAMKRRAAGRDSRTSPEAASVIAGMAARAPSTAAATAPISISDPRFKPTGSGDDKETAFQRETRQIRESTQALIAKQIAIARLNPLVEDYGFALAKAEAEQELLAAAQKEGLAITPALRQQISQLATGYASATAAAAQFAESQDKIRERAEEFRDLAKETLGGFISDIRSGTSALESLGNALNRVADKLIDMAVSNLFGGLFGGGGSPITVGGQLYHSGGVVGNATRRRSVSPFVFAGAPRMHGGGIAGLKPNEVPAILERGEIVLPKMPGRSRAAAPTFSYSPVINAPGATAEAVTALAQAMIRDRAEFESRVRKIVADRPNKRW